MADLIEGIHPTRMELLNVKHKTNLAEKGHRLLKEKRDALFLEFMSTAREAENTASSTVKQLMNARESMLIANSILGLNELESIALSSDRSSKAEINYRNVMGVALPRISKPDLKRKPDERGYSLALTHPLVDDVAEEYEKTAGSVLDLLEVETTLKALSDETKRTKRRVNALEYNILPKLKNTKKYIEMRLGELERENFHRLKMVKRKRG